MPKYNNYQLNEEQRAAIEEAIRSEKRVDVVRRATALRMLDRGHLVSEVEAVLGVKHACVYRWYHRFQEEGMEGLVNRPKSGRPSKTDAGYWEALERTLEQDPTELGYPFSVWTVPDLAAQLEQVTGIKLSPAQLRLQMKRRGYVWRRPKHDLHALQDAAARADMLALLTALKKEPSKGSLSSSLWTKVR